MTWSNAAGLSGRVYIVTGAAGAIGGSVARALAEAGAIVACVDRQGSGLDTAVSSLAGRGHVSIESDLRDISRHDQVVAQAARSGQLGGLAHVAAVISRNDDVFAVTEDDWDLQHDVNLKATFFLDRAVAAHFRDAGTGGSIVNFASQGWWTGGAGGSIPYAASKGGVVSLTRGLAKSLAPLGIRVNAVSPGGVDTAMMRDGLTNAARSAFIETIPAGRLADPDDLSGAVLYLLSDSSSYVTGTVLNVSGGQLMY